MSKKSIIVISIAAALVTVNLFVFVEIPHSSVDTSDWETYASDEYGFEFKYPKDSQVVRYGDGEGLCVAQFGVSVREISKYNEGGRWAAIALIGGRIANIRNNIGEGGVGEFIIFKKDNLVYTVHTCSARHHEKVRRDILKTFRIEK